MPDAHPSVQHGDIAAVVVGYHPNFFVLDVLLMALLDQAALVILIDNGASADFLVAHPALRSRISYQAMGSNLGLGAALNVGFSIASEQGYEYAITFDQDSAIKPGMLNGLLQVHQTLVNSGVRCAAVGPCFYDRRETGAIRLFPLFKEHHGRIQVHQVHNTRPSCPIQVDTLITSGMLVSMAVWQTGLHYNPWLMVDYTDTDWCFRARADGWQLHACPDIALGHALSDATPIRLFGLNFLRYSPLRRYYYFRNTLFFVRQPYVSWAWRRRLLAGITVRLIINPFIDDRAWPSLVQSVRGLWDGLTKRT